MKEPIMKSACWECPDCGWQNPYPSDVIATYPPTRCFRCLNCDYHFDEIIGEHSPAMNFSIAYPKGKPKEVGA